MNRILYLDCSSGISGDMFLGSLIDCGLEVGRLASRLRKMKIGDYDLKSSKVTRAGITGIKFDVLYDIRHIRKHSDKKTFRSVAKSIRASALSVRVKEKSIAVFTELAKAESKAHGVPVEEVHFHEVGDIDSVVDIVGSCIALEELDIGEVYSSRIIVANPAPATAYLLRGLDIEIVPIPCELVTPTGAALIKTFLKSQTYTPPMRIIKVGHGAGSKEIPGRPNLLRALICEARTNCDREMVTVLETNIDDMNPQIYEYLIDRLFESGALDVYITPVIMKKSRPACVLTVLAEPSDADRLATIVFEETTTYGLRQYRAERQKLERKIVEVKTKYGNIDMKLGFFKGALKSYSPEYESCKKIAKLKHIPFASVWREAETEARRRRGEKSGFVK